MDSEGFGREQAAAALATIEESRDLIRAEQAERRGHRCVMRGLFALTPLVEYAPKDLIRSRAVRWTIRVAWQAGLFALGRRPPVISRMPAFRAERSVNRPTVLAVTTVAAMAVSEHLVVRLLRRSRLRRPNVVAGLVVAPLRAGFRFLLGRITRGDQANPISTGAAEPHPALLPPETLRIAALLGGGELVDLAFVREAFGIDRLTLARQLQPLVDGKLAATLYSRDTAKVYLTADGRVAFAQHEQALRAVSTGDTPR